MKTSPTSGSQNTHYIPRAVIQARREMTFLALSGLFLGAMVMLNVIGLTKFVQLGPLTVAVGVLPYPLTFLCTDLISEFFGRKRATQVVWMGLFLNIFVLGIMWLGHHLPSAPQAGQPPWQILNLSEEVFLANGQKLVGEVEFFHLIYASTAGAVLASMLAYMGAQFCDVQLFHFWKKVTKGRHLWIRNNFSTMVSQLVDSFMVIAITFGAAFLRDEIALSVLFTLFLSNYAFKFTAAAVDTLPLYYIRSKLSKYLEIDPYQVYEGPETPS